MSMSADNTTSFNSTEEPKASGSTILIKDWIHYLILAVLIIIVNATVIVAVWRKRMLRKWQNYLLVSLAFSDLSMGLIGLPLLLLCTLYEGSYLTTCILCHVAYTFSKFLSISTVLHLLTVTYERFLFIVYPFHHERLSSKHVRFKLVLAGVWLTSLAVALVPFTWTNLAHCADSGNSGQWVLYTIVTLIIFLIVPMVLFIFAFVSMFMVARVHIRKQEALLNRLPNSESNAARKEARVVIIFVLMWGVFIVCWTPYFVLNIMDELEVEVALPDRLWVAANVLRFLTSFLNPLLYSFLKKDFCQALGLMCLVERGVCRGCCVPFNKRNISDRQEVPMRSNAAAHRLLHSENETNSWLTQVSTV